jgi:ankyrin repeat protein
VDLPGPVQKQLLTALESLSEDRAQPEWRKAEASWAAAVFYILRLGTVRPIDSDDLSKGMTGYSLNADAVLSHLERAADLGYVPAQAAYRRVAAAIGQPPSESDKTWAKVKRWLVNATKNGSRVASTDLRWIDFDCWREADRTFRSDYCGIGEEAFSAEDRQHYPLEDLNTLKENLLINRRWELGDTAGLRCLAALNVRGDTLLHWSAMAGADAAMALLLNDFSESIDINQRNYHDETPLLCACRSGHYKIAKRLLAAGADAGMPNDVEENALHFLGSFLEPDNAVIEIARDLVGAGAAIDQVAVASSIPQAYASAAHAAGTPLQRATANEERKAITALLELKADPWSGERKSPIEMSCTLHSYEILRQFLQYPIRQPEWVARSVVEPEGLLEILQCLFIEQRSFQLGAPNAFARLTDMQDRQSLLGHAVRPELQHLRMFLHGGDLKRNLEQTLLVLQSSAEQDWSRVDSFGTNALMHAVGSRDVDLVQHLLSRYFAEVCPSLVTPTPSGYGVYLPIHIAVGTQVKPIFDILLDLTGLDSVVSPPRVPGLEFLEEWMETSSGYTIATLPANTEIASIVHLCATHSDDIYFCGRILESLEDTTDFVNRKGVRGETPFSVAVTNNFFAVADLLLAHGADIDLECGPSKTMKVTYTALGCVLRLNNDSTHAAVRYLLSRGASFIVNRQMGLSAIQCSCTSNLAYDLDPIATEELFTYKWDTKNLEILLKHFSGTQFLDHKDELQDETALHMAVKNGNLDAVKMLLEAGASPTVCKTFADGQEISPVDYAFVMAQGGYVLPPIKAKGDVAVDKFKGRAREIWSTLTNCEWSDSVLE